MLQVFWQAVAGAALCSWPIYSWLRNNVKQKIDPHAPPGHQAKQGTPTMGGLIILAGAVIALVLNRFREAPFSLGTSLHGGSKAESAHTLDVFLLLLIGFGMIGFVDDFVVPRMMAGKRGLGWKQKLALEILVSGIASSMIFPSFGLNWFSTIFLILFFSNAYNFADGLDGLSGSIWIGLTLGIVGLTTFVDLNLALPMVAIAGATLVFLGFNAPPAKIFMGDVGSLPLGAVLGAIISVLSMKSDVQVGWLPILILSLLMIAELVPVPMQVAYFKLTKGKRLFPSTPIHHGFEKKGWPESRVVWTFALLQLLCSVAAYSIALGMKQ
ncbi:MAG: hypothetical protein ABL949_13685 [Fimbriimonadaceae bacterium]